MLFCFGFSWPFSIAKSIRTRSTKGKSLMFAFEGGYHGRTLGASAITSSYRYRRRFGPFGRGAQ